jgi:hypothetical protein
MNIDYHPCGIMQPYTFLAMQLLEAVFSDLEKAYGTASQCRIVYTIHRCCLRKHPQIFSSNIITDHHFCVCFDAKLLLACVQKNGVPQGSTHGDTPFVVAISDITN